MRANIARFGSEIWSRSNFISRELSARSTAHTAQSTLCSEIALIKTWLIGEAPGKPKKRSPGRGVGGQGRPGPDPKCFRDGFPRYSITDQANRYAVGRASPPCIT